MARALGRGVTVAQLGGGFLRGIRASYRFLPTYFLKYSLGVALFSTSKVYLFITLCAII